jgi:hypothetical protein
MSARITYGTRDLRWRPLTTSEPTPGSACLVRAARFAILTRGATGPHRAIYARFPDGSAWAFTDPPTACRTQPTDQWRPEDDR